MDGKDEAFFAGSMICIVDVVRYVFGMYDTYVSQGRLLAPLEPHVGASDARNNDRCHVRARPLHPRTTSGYVTPQSRSA